MDIKMNVKMTKLTSTARYPERGSDHAAGYDLFADCLEPVLIRPGETAFIGTGLSMAIPSGYFGGIAARSGLSCKHGIAPANKLGVIDSDYRGEVKVALHNHSSEEYTIHPGDRIAQLLVIPVASIDIQYVDSLDDTDRGQGGFGSTGN